MGSSGYKSHFSKLQQFTPDYCPNTITQYESTRTGMRAIVVDQEGPKLYGFFALATEIHDDSGAPHTLEHLCFMGSKTYQYKGFLDKLATRVYSGTNAWTATDHTAYTLDTAGWAGFRSILPIYLEHVILPTLTDSGCKTEVFHIDGSGNDAGVVYSEMQGIQNTASERIDLRAKRLLYPEGVGFRYETGGMLEALRVLTAQRIRDFHREMYQPKNLCLVLTGELNHEELLQTLDDFEETILDDIPSPNKPFQRPWIESKQAPPLTSTTVEKVEFPEEDESYGQIEIRFLGPNGSDLLAVGALAVSLLYLAGSSAAVLDNALVEREQLTSGVYFTTDTRPRTEITFSLTGVKTDKLAEVEQRFFAVLKEAMAQDLNMDFIRDCIERQVRTIKFEAENSSSFLADAILSDYLFGKRDGSTLQDLKSLNTYADVLALWTQSQWKDFINEHIANAHHISILGVPSAKLSEKLQKDETERVEEQKKKLGPEGLKLKEEELEKAKAENDREIPKELLAKFKVPPTESIHFVKTSPARVGPALELGKPNNKYQEIVDQDETDTPLFINFEHIPSNFARVNLIISAENIPLELRPLLSVYQEAFFNIPIKRNGQVIDFEQVVVELERDTVGYSTDLADRLGTVESLRISFQVEVEKYDVAISWIKALLWDTVFDVERLKAVNSRLLADVPDSKRSGSTMLTAVQLMVHLAPESIGRSRTTLVKALYLKRIKQLLKDDPDKVVQLLEQLRESICKFENFKVLVVADLEKLQKPVSAWKPFLEGLDVTKKLLPNVRRIERLSEAGHNPGKLAYVIPMPTMDSSYAYTVAKGPSSWTDSKLPALMVAMSYMNAVEGPLWVAVRGTGLAYGTSMSYDIESGFLFLEIYRSPDAYKAFVASRQIIEGHMNGDIEFDPLMLEGAISSIVVSFANEQGSLANAAVANFVRAAIRGLPSDYMDTMLRKVRAIEIEDIKETLKSLVFNLFTPDKTDVLVTCSPGLQEPIKEGLQTAGFNPQVHDLTWFQDDYGLKVEGSDDIDDEDDDDDDEDDDDKDNEKDKDEQENDSDFEMVDENVSDEEKMR